MLGLTLVGVLAMIGIMYVWVLYQRKKCRCRLCRGDLVLGECIGSGGFGEVYKVTLLKKSYWREELDQIYDSFWSASPFPEKDDLNELTTKTTPLKKGTNKKAQKK